MKAKTEGGYNNNHGVIVEATGKDETYISRSKVNELKTENESLIQENLKLQSIIHDVTTVNKRWQKYNNERRLYVQKLLSTIQDLQEQINFMSEKSAFQNQTDDAGARDNEVENLKKEHQEQIAVLELQIKSHKDDWDAERKEKRKALQEKEDLEVRVQELSREVKFLKDVLQEERQRKATICALCGNEFEENMVYPKMDYYSEPGSIKLSNITNPNFSAAMHVPFETNKMSNNGYYYTKEDLLTGDEDLSAYNMEKTDSTQGKEEFSGKSKSIKNLLRDTVVVEDESGIRLSITEQTPPKGGNLKSILKKSDKKSKVVTKIFSDQRNILEEKEYKFNKKRLPADRPNIACEEFVSKEPLNYELSVGFQGDGLAHVTSFTPDFIQANMTTHFRPAPTIQLLKVNPQDSKSKSEPNTRSNSSENLKPLRESSSWNNSLFGVKTNERGNISRSNYDSFPSFNSSSVPQLL